jgi:hypothetical protein
MILAILAHMAVVYVPHLEWLVRTTPLSGWTLAGILLLALTVVLTVEVDKHIFRRERRIALKLAKV